MGGSAAVSLNEEREMGIIELTRAQRQVLSAMVGCTARRNREGRTLDVDTGELAQAAGKGAGACLSSAKALSAHGLVRRKGDASFSLTELGLVEIRRLRDRGLIK